MRAVIYMALRGVLRVQGRPEVFVTFLLDELAQLGRMSAIEDAVSLMAGYGAWLWLLVQDLSQLKAAYPKWETFLANTTLQAFGTQDQYTARYLSEALGSQTILIESEQQSRSSPEDFMRTGSSTQGTALAHHGRPLMMPDEIRRMNESEVIVLQQGEPPYNLRRLDYLTDPGQWSGQSRRMLGQSVDKILYRSFLGAYYYPDVQRSNQRPDVRFQALVTAVAPFPAVWLVCVIILHLKVVGRSVLGAAQVLDLQRARGFAFSLNTAAMSGVDRVTQRCGTRVRSNFPP